MSVNPCFPSSQPGLADTGGCRLHADSCSPNDIDTDQAGRLISWSSILHGRHGIVRPSPFPFKWQRNLIITSYGFQTTTKLRMILSVALVDAMIKDADIVSVSI